MKRSVVILIAIIATAVIWVSRDDALKLAQDAAVSDSALSHQYASSDLDGVVSKGNINGILIGIPQVYQKHRIEYEGKSIWGRSEERSASQESHSYEERVSAFSLYVKWPDMQPHGTSSSSREERGESSWLTIAVDDDYARQPRPPTANQNGLARKLSGIIRRVSERQQIVNIRSATDSNGDAFESFESSIRYEMRGKDHRVDMNWAEPVGVGTERFHSWNLDLFWRGDMSRTVTDLVSCYKGEMPSIDAQQKCSHDFYLEEWGASVTVTYPRSLLPEWKRIKLSTKKLILSFQNNIDSN